MSGDSWLTLKARSRLWVKGVCALPLALVGQPALLSWGISCPQRAGQAQGGKDALPRPEGGPRWIAPAPAPRRRGRARVRLRAGSAAGRGGQSRDAGCSVRFLAGPEASARRPSLHHARPGRATAPTGSER